MLQGSFRCLLKRVLGVFRVLGAFLPDRTIERAGVRFMQVSGVGVLGFLGFFAFFIFRDSRGFWVSRALLLDGSLTRAGFGFLQFTGFRVLGVFRGYCGAVPWRALKLANAQRLFRFLA